MFICHKCAEKEDCAVHGFELQSFGPCEVCGRTLPTVDCHGGWPKGQRRPRQTKEQAAQLAEYDR